MAGRGFLVAIASVAAALLLLRCSSFSGSDVPGGGSDAAVDGGPPASDAAGCVPDAHLFCVDFDEGVAPSTAFSATSGSLGVDNTTATSPPASMLATGTASAPAFAVYENKSVAAKKITARVAYYRGPFDNETNTAVMKVNVSAAGGDVNITLSAEGTTGNLVVQEVLSDGGFSANSATLPLGVPVSTWTILRVTVDVSAASGMPKVRS